VPQLKTILLSEVVEVLARRGVDNKRAPKVTARRRAHNLAVSAFTGGVSISILLLALETPPTLFLALWILAAGVLMTWLDD
jgi:hypothetical protein